MDIQKDNKAIESPEVRELTIKQRKWLKLYIKEGNATKAAMEVYDCKDEHSAAQIGYENLRKLDIAEVMEEKGISNNKLLNKVNEGLEATRTISAVKGTSANGGTTDFIDVPDYATQHKYLETALRLKKIINDKSLGIELKDEDKIIRVIVSDFV